MSSTSSYVARAVPDGAPVARQAAPTATVAARPVRTPRSPFAGDWAADESTPAATWLNAMRALAASGDSQQAVDAIFEKIDGLLDRGAYAECDALVRTIDVDRFGTFELVAFLAATLAAAASLPSRPTLVNAAERRLRELAPDRVERLMSGLHAT